MGRVKGRKRVGSGKESFRRKRETEGQKPTHKKEWGKASPRKPRDAKESNCSPPTDRWPASPRARAAPAILHPPVLLLSTASRAVGYPFGELGADVPAVSPPSALGTPSLLAWRGSRRSRKALGAVQALLSTDSHAPGFSRLFSAQTQNIAPYELLGRT